MTDSEHRRQDFVQEPSLEDPSPSGLALEFDGEGVPLSAPVESWLGLWPAPDGSAVRPDVRSLLATLRFSRPDGSPVFGARGKQPGRLRDIANWADSAADASVIGAMERLMDTAGTRKSVVPIIPPAGSFSSSARPLAVFRPDWSPRGDLVAIDHRTPGRVTRLEVASKGRVWLGPDWSSPSTKGKVGLPVVGSRTSSAYAESVEWSFQTGKTRTTRMAVLLKGQGVALLSQEEEGPGPSIEARFSIPQGIEAILNPEQRSLTLSSGRGRPVARLIPLGLPCSPYRTGQGSLAVEGREVVVRQVSEGARRWLGVLVSWERAPASWRVLTVAARSQATPDDVAFAARVAWKQRGGTLVVYRSMAPPELRTFLGHQTRARMIVGSFDPLGDVRPLLKLE